MPTDPTYLVPIGNCTGNLSYINKVIEKGLGGGPKIVFVCIL